MNVRFKNFRGFRDTDFLNLKKITLLVGENSSGKTSFLGGLRHLSGLMAGENIDLNSPPFEMGTFKDIINQQNPEQSEFIYEYSENEVLNRWVFYDDEGKPSLRQFEAKCVNAKKNEKFIYNKETKSVKFCAQLSLEDVQILKDICIDTNEIPGNGYYNFELYNADLLHATNHFLYGDYVGFLNARWAIESSFLILLTKTSEDEDEDENEQEFPAEHFINNASLQSNEDLANKIADSIFKLRIKFLNTVALSDTRMIPSRIYQFSQLNPGLDPSGIQIPDKLQLLLKSNKASDKETIKQIKKFGQESGLFKNLSIKRYDKKSNYPFSIIVTTTQGIKSNIIDVGNGVSQTLPLVFEILSCQDKTRFLLQQPEIHLHPRAQSAFGSLMAQSVRNKGTEFVVETHSDFILERLKYEIAKGVISHNDVGILFFDTEEKEVKVWQIDIDKSGLPIDPPAAYRRFFFEETERVWF